MAKLLELKAKLGDEAQGSGAFTLKCPKVCQSCQFCFPFMQFLTYTYTCIYVHITCTNSMHLHPENHIEHKNGFTSDFVHSAAHVYLPSVLYKLVYSLYTVPVYVLIGTILKLPAHVKLYTFMYVFIHVPTNEGLSFVCDRALETMTHSKWPFERRCSLSSHRVSRDTEQLQSALQSLN